MCKHKPETVHPSNKKAICLFYSYLAREPLKIEHYQKDLERVLSYSDLFIENIYDMCFKFTQIHLIQRDFKNFGYKCMQTVYDFSENVHQQISHVQMQNSFYPFFQLPYFNDNKLRLLKRANGKIFNNKPTCYYDFVKMDIEARNDLLSKEFTNEQIDDINRAIDAIPIYELNVEVFTEGFEDVLVEDEVSIKVSVIRTNLQEGQQVGLTHSLGFTELFEEKVALSLVTNKFILDNSIETITERVTEHVFNYRPTEPGKFNITCDMISLDYKGVNISKEFEVNVQKTSEKRKEHLKDIEKRQIKKIEPSYFQQILSSVVPIGGDDDEEEEEEEEKNDEEKGKKENKDEKDKEKDEKDKEEDEKDKEKEKDEKDDNKKEEEKKDEEKDGHEKQD
jgi:hypothetical protein